MSSRILRITTAGAHFTSADAFERAFMQGVRAPGTEIVTRDISEFLSGSALIAGSGPRLSRKTLNHEAVRFETTFGGYAVICPDYQHLFVTPFLMALRNLARCDVSFCVIAHSPGLCGVEWALFAKLMTSRDAIVAPTRFARSSIEFLAPGLSPHIRVIGHPIPRDFLAHVASGGAVRPRPQIATLLSLSRIIPTKLIHRQIDAMAVLAARGMTEVRLLIAGAVQEEATGRLTPYARALKAQTRRLGLNGRIEFLGLVRSVERRVELIRHASALINLSCTLEESFGKAIAEALCAEKPVVVTRWNGLPETVGSCGACVAVSRDPRTGNLDVDPEALADAILRMVDTPMEPARFRRAQQRSDPSRVGATYRALWTALRRGRPAYPATQDDLADRELPAAPAGGLLARTAPLPIMSWRNLFAFYLDDARAHCASLKLASFRSSSERPSSGGAPGPSIRSIVIQGTSSPLERLFAHATARPPGRSTLSPTLLPFSTRLQTHTARALDGDWTRSSRLACVLATPNVFLKSPRRRRRALEAFDDGSLESIVALAKVGAYDVAYQRCLEGLDVGDDDSHLLVRPLARIAMRLNKAEEALDKLLAWIRTHPDHFATPALLSDLAWLVEGPSVRPETKLRIFEDCLEVLDDLDDASPALETMRRTVAGHRMTAVFGR